MTTLNSIIKELKDVPVNRLEELFQLIQSLTTKKKVSERTRKKILSFSGSFADMTDKDYADFVEYTKKVREQLFNRTSNL